MSALRRDRRVARAPSVAALLLCAAAAPAAQRQQADVCPWCAEGRPELAAALGHGPMPLLGADSEAFAAAYDESAWRFLETPHFRFASSLGDENLSSRDLLRLEADLARLREAFPKLPARPRKLDPWLRLHWMALRAESFYARFQTLLRVTDADFPAARGDGPFMGDGPFLGEKEKFEVVLHEARETHFRVTEEQTGVRVTDTMRWHSRAPHKLVVSIPAVDSDLRQDRWLLPHVVHNLSHMLFAAYKHFSYDPPVWLDEGLAHAMEREVEPESWTREGEEGTFRERGRARPWDEQVKALVARGKAPSVAALLRLHTIGELDEDAHACCWSLARFLLDRHAEQFAALLGGIKGQLDERGYPSGKDLPTLQRRLLQELWSWTPIDLDAAWRDFVLAPPER